MTYNRRVYDVILTSVKRHFTSFFSFRAFYRWNYGLHKYLKHNLFVEAITEVGVTKNELLSNIFF